MLQIENHGVLIDQFSSFFDLGGLLVAPDYSYIFKVRASQAGRLIDR